MGAISEDVDAYRIVFRRDGKYHIEQRRVLHTEWEMLHGRLYTTIWGAKWGLRKWKRHVAYREWQDKQPARTIVYEEGKP